MPAFEITVGLDVGGASYLPSLNAEDNYWYVCLAFLFYLSLLCGVWLGSRGGRLTHHVSVQLRRGESFFFDGRFVGGCLVLMSLLLWQLVFASSRQEFALAVASGGIEKYLHLLFTLFLSLAFVVISSKGATSDVVFSYLGVLFSSLVLGDRSLAFLYFVLLLMRLRVRLSRTQRILLLVTVLFLMSGWKQWYAYGKRWF